MIVQSGRVVAAWGDVNRRIHPVDIEKLLNVEFDGAGFPSRFYY